MVKGRHDSQKYIFTYKQKRDTKFKIRPMASAIRTKYIKLFTST